jgi:hypothetical protein
MEITNLVTYGSKSSENRNNVFLTGRGGGRGVVSTQFSGTNENTNSNKDDVRMTSSKQLKL